MTILAVFLMGAVVGRGSPAADLSPRTYPAVVSVSKTFDGKPFAYRIDSRAERSGYWVYRLSYPSPVVTPVPQNNTVPAEYYVPSSVHAGEPKRPAVICIHILDGNMELVRMTAAVLASHGVPAILFKLPYYGERGLPGGPEAMAHDPKMFLSAISQAMQDVRRTVDLLASRPEIDGSRIGITGISLGGITAATAAEYEPRLSRAMLVLSGGDLMKIIHHARETQDLSRLINGLPDKEKAEVEKIISEVDPVQHADRLRDRAKLGRVLMVNAAEDEVVPRECTESLASSLGIAQRVQWLDGLGHYTAMAELPQVLQEMAEFFAQDLPPGTQVAPPPSGAAVQASPVQVLLAIVQQGVGFLTTEPAKGHCHLADVEVSATLQGHKPMEGRLPAHSGHPGEVQVRMPGARGRRSGHRSGGISVDALAEEGRFPGHQESAEQAGRPFRLYRSAILAAAEDALRRAGGRGPRPRRAGAFRCDPARAAFQRSFGNSRNS